MGEMTPGKEERAFRLLAFAKFHGIGKGRKLYSSLKCLQKETENLDGKTPSPLSDLQETFYTLFIRSGIVEGSFTEDGCLASIDKEQAKLLISITLEYIDLMRVNENKSPEELLPLSDIEYALVMPNLFDRKERRLLINTLLLATAAREQTTLFYSMHLRLCGLVDLDMKHKRLQLTEKGRKYLWAVYGEWVK